MKENETFVLMNSWLDGAIRSYGYVGGTRGIRNFLRGAAEVVVDHLRQAAGERGKQVLMGSDPAAMVSDMVEIENVLNIMPSEQLEIDQGEAGELQMTMVGCPYAHVCADILSDLIRSNFSREGLPCFRAEVYAAALSPQDRRRSRYVLNQFAPGDQCTATLRFLE